MATLPKGMEHVDRRKLYTSLPARVFYLQQFLEFGPDDVTALSEGQKCIKAIIPAIVNMVYKKLLRHDITARVFSTRDSRSEEDPDRWIGEEDAQIRHRKMFLRWYLTKLNSDPSKMEYWQYLDKVGLMHVGKGRKNPLHVDYIFLGACLGYIQDSMTEAILSHPRLDLTQKIAIVRALGKVIWIQNDLMAKWHVEDGKEFADSDRNDELQAEAQQPEGYVNGKRVLGKVDEDDSSIDGTASSISSEKSTTSLGRTIEQVGLSNEQIKCPFSGIANGGQELDSQRAATWRPRRDDPGVSPSSPTGAPRLRVIDGKTVGKEKLGLNPFE
ncbi:hypothetical protein LTR99_009042 [Exophiala xenobiotica]|uniref:Globin-sensor domain-containing protein n=1 Tax=Vermiconidia calcicola TaxID=1690605 RepID=A0AAV9Q181_9PEZI|nr:hypothetical protein LTR92_000787 [Exophiala xenobiotica]KAK5532308.1 hypothetical protein LTR25_007841 [Vermiconidia calcicola]KAK5541846.1 hypothetical protein LTR23_005448 [Chaetothyriales sp. CCFEE 6169]KAK5206550.1 hypothetical protein LTR41_007988 [Exophiala xenobiotica]KAK5264836.1 hypothetical protein LTR96_009635 [Exophiala xenobiotica]